MKLLSTSGIVTSLRKDSDGNDVYTLINDHSAVSLISNLELSLMESVDVQYGEDLRISSMESKGRADAALYERTVSALVEKVGTSDNACALDFGPISVADKASLITAISDAVESLLRSYLTGAPLIVRFHNDGDGSTGALALYRALSSIDPNLLAGGRASSWIMNKSIAYTSESAYLDANMFAQHTSVEMPVLLITDFGTSAESKAGIEIIREKANVIWIDHHMPYKGFDSNGARYINSWNFGSDSNMTAGALTSFFAQSISGSSYGELIRASFISDYSKYADPADQAAVRLATVLDYMTAKNKHSLNPKQIEAVISDAERFATTFATAAEQMEEAVALGINTANRYQTGNDIQVFVVDFSPIAEKDQGFPLPGRFSSKLQGKLEEINGARVITVVHFGSFISMRISKAISGEVDILGVIEKLKLSDAEIGGGGHAEAASIRVPSKNIKDALRLLLVELGAVQ